MQVALGWPSLSRAGCCASMTIDDIIILDTSGSVVTCLDSADGDTASAVCLEVADEGWFLAEQENSRLVKSGRVLGPGTYVLKAKKRLPPFHPNTNNVDESMVRQIAEETMVTQLAQMKLTRPRRDLSVNSFSDAWNLMVHDNRVTRGHDFFFALRPLPEEFSTTAFKEKGKTEGDDENKVHHPYFLKQAGVLVKDAIASGMVIKQQLLWTKHGKWLTLDDSPSNGTEPDFSMMALDSGNRCVSTEKDKGPPSSKYKVSVVLEQKKKFTESDTMEAIDYGQRLLRVQRERHYAITALFHCGVEEKIIRWVQVELGDDGKFRAKVTRPANLAGEDGQQQLLALLSMSSPELGLDRPSVDPFNTEAVCDIRWWMGRGATSKVYAANWLGTLGALKILEPDYVPCVDREVNILKKLKDVSGVPRAEKIANNAIFFDKVLVPMEGCMSSSVNELVSRLRDAHGLQIVHRDVRPENVMKSAKGEAVLNDWGCSSETGTTVSFAGTFRYASDEVLDSAIRGEKRAPQPKDDLHSLVRTVLAMNDVELRREVSNIDDGEYGAAKALWMDWRNKNPVFQSFFGAAENLQYDTLYQLR